jgi:TM2 domain-containing membrane protein YozV
MPSTLYDVDLYSAEAARDAIAVRVRYEARKKTTAAAVLLVVFFGLLGAHRFYAGRMGSGAAMLLLTATSLATLGSAYGVAGLVGVAVWSLIDAFRLPQLIGSYNRSLMISLGH